MKLPRTSWPVTKQIWDKLTQILQRSISFGSVTGGEDNIDGVWLTTTTPSVADTEFTLTHNLGRIPQGSIVVSIDVAGTIYKGVTAWTETQLSLKCNIASANLVLFII